MFVHSSFKKPWYLFCYISLGLVGCNNAKYTECQQIIEIANQANHQTQEMITQSSQPIEPKIWLEAASIMNQAAEQINALPLDDPQLVNYQNNLVKIFRIYSQSTDDALEARENRNLKALETAVAEAKKAGLLKDELVTGINSYCLGKAD